MPPHARIRKLPRSPVNADTANDNNPIMPENSPALFFLLTAIAIKAQKSGKENLATYPPGTKSPYGQVSHVFGSIIVSEIKIQHIINIPTNMEININILISLSFANQT